MPRIEISDELAARLEQAARERGCSVEDVLASTFGLTAEVVRNHPLVAYTLSPEFRGKLSEADRLLALLGWVAAHHASEFRDFVLHLESGQKYVCSSPEEIRETCLHNQARQIPGTHYWAIMNLDTPTKRRFLHRLLVFVGESDDVIDAATSALSPRAGGREFAVWSARTS